MKFHDSINPVSKKSKTASFLTAMIKPTVGELEKLASFATKPDQQKISVGIDKNATLADY
jgi:hypothetical protein